MLAHFPEQRLVIEPREKVDFDKYGECAKKIIKGLAKYSNEMAKRGMLIAGDF